MLGDRGAFDALAALAGEVDRFGVRGGLAGGPVELDGVDAGPPRAEDHVVLRVAAVAGDHDLGVDGVVGVAFERFEDLAVVDPGVVGVGRVEGGVGRQADQRALGAEGGGRVVDVVGPARAVEVDGGRPQVVDAGHGLLDPGGLLVEDGADGAPGPSLVEGLADGDGAVHEGPVTGRQDVPGLAFASGDQGRVVGAQLAEHGAGGRFGGVAAAGVGVPAGVGERGRGGGEERADDRQDQSGADPGAA